MSIVYGGEFDSYNTLTIPGVDVSHVGTYSFPFDVSIGDKEARSYTLDFEFVYCEYETDHASIIATPNTVVIYGSTYS